MIGSAELNGVNAAVYAKGKELYEKDGYCGTCHQPNGQGLTNSGFPPLAKSRYVLQDEERLIKIALKGLQGPLEVNGKKYDGQVPMTPFEGLLNDEEMAAVLSYVRNAFGNQAPPISPEKVKMVRER
jgi:mono/diheme cytochrome c family protein